MASRSPIWPVVREVEVRPEPRRIGWPGALWIFLRALAEPPQDPRLARLSDAEDLIVAGHTALAIERLQALGREHAEMLPRCLGLISLALHDLGQERQAEAMHRTAVLLGGAHPVMIEIFGTRET